MEESSSLQIAAFGIGSTNFRYVLGTPSDGFLTEVRRAPTDAVGLETRVVHAITELEHEADGGLDAVSIAVTGQVDREAGTIREFDTADGQSRSDVRLAAAIDERFGLPAVVENGRVVRGEHGSAAEVGLFPVCATGALESFGVHGAWEAYCSGRGIPAFVRSLLDGEDRETALRDVGELTAPDVFAVAADGDAVATDYLDRIGRLNAAGIGAVANAYDPGLVTIGGGVALNNREEILGGILRYVDAYCYGDVPRIEVTPLGDYVGLYGALGLFAGREMVSVSRGSATGDAWVASK